MTKKIDVQKISDDTFKILISDEENNQKVEVNISGIDIQNIQNLINSSKITSKPEQEQGVNVLCGLICPSQ